MDEQLEWRAAPVERVDVDARTLVVRLCRWDDPHPVRDRDGAQYREQWARGSMRLAEPAYVVDAHGGNLIGWAGDLRDGDDGPTVELTIARSSAGNDALALIDSATTRSVSVEFTPAPDGAIRDGDLITRTAAVVHGVAFAFRPAHDAPILHRDETPMTDVMPDTSPVPARRDATDVAVLELRGDLDELIQQVATLPRDLSPGSAAHPLAQYRSLGQFVRATWDDAIPPAVLMRALVDQITTDNPGVIPPGWVREVKGIVDAGRPLVTAFGVESTPSSGMDVNWPYFDGDLLTLVGQQATEKTAIVSVKVSLKRGTEGLDTYAGGSDLSYQLIRRSDPSYLDAYMRIMMAAYAAVTDKAAGTAATTVATGTGTWDATATDAAAGLRAALFAASVDVAAVTGTPASFAVAASDVFVKIGSLDGLWPAMYGTNNTAGTADARSLVVNVSGLPVIHDPYLPAGTLIVSNGQAGGWFEDGPFTVTAEDVEKLGQNVAVWGMGAFGGFSPAGIVEVAVTLTTVP